ncbi:hypothetical protein ABEX78_32145 [Priestia megaterium]
MEVKVIKTRNGKPTVIEYDGQRFIYDIQVNRPKIKAKKLKEAAK